MVNNQTNLAIKGIIAIQAMSKMASVVNQTDDVYMYAVRIGTLFCMSGESYPIAHRMLLRISTLNGRAMH